MGTNDQQQGGQLKDILNTKSAPNSSVTTLRKAKLDDATVDIGALMRKALQAPKLKSDAVAAGTKQSKETTADLELRGNPIYSPDDSLQKAASKLANLKAAGNGIKPSGGANAGPSHGALTPIHHENEASRKPHPPDGVTPGWMPHAEDGEAPKAEIKLAAHSVISKRNRRKSVYQRPARYGEWFDGDDEELDKMVEASNEDEEGDTIAASAANAARQQQDLKDRSNRRKSAFPAVGRPAPAAVASQSPADAGANIANQVRAIADGLCERLDGLIEESPAIPKGLGQREDGKTLRDKLLESWEGRSYYDRLMQLAAENGEKDAGRQQALDAARAESARLAQGSAQGTRPAASPAPAGTGDAEAEADVPPPALSFLSPPKPKLRVQVEKALDAVPPARKLPAEPVAVVEPKPAPAAPLEAAPARAKAPAKEAEVQAADSNLRLLKVSARGPKPMPAPWEGVEEEEREGNAEAVADTAPKQQINAAPGLSSPGKATKKVAQSVANIGHVRPALAVPASPVVKSSSGPTDAERAAIAEVESLKAALAEALAAKEAAVAETAAVRAAMAELQSKLEEAEEEAKAQEEANEAAEKRIAVLEKQMQSLEQQGNASDGAVKAIKKIGEKAPEVEGRFGLAEVQLEALMAAANALAEHMAQGRAEAQEIVEAAQAAVPAAAEAGRRKTRGRRKSGWR